MTVKQGFAILAIIGLFIWITYEALKLWHVP